jgi:hypothetical protein
MRAWVQSVKESGLVAARWSGEFGYGLSDELDALAAEWRDRLGMADVRNNDG